MPKGRLVCCYLSFGFSRVSFGDTYWLLAVANIHKTEMATESMDAISTVRRSASVDDIDGRNLATTKIIIKSDGQTNPNTNTYDNHRTPLPKLQLAILFYIQLAEPIASTVIYPFVNQLVRKTGVTRGDERKTGYFAGEHVYI